MTEPALLYVLRHVVTGRWVARRRGMFYWNARRRLACKVRGGTKLDRFLAERCVLLVEGRPEVGCDVVALAYVHFHKGKNVGPGAGCRKPVGGTA